MLKKLVRYGNSNALVIDKAILELLNIGEGSVVKLSTDGKSIVITPQETVEQESVQDSVTSEEIMHQNAANQVFANDKAGPELEKKKAAYIALLKKQSELLQSACNNSEYVKEMQTNLLESNGDYTVLAEKNKKTQQKYLPDLDALQKDIAELSGTTQEEFNQQKEKFTKLFSESLFRDVMFKLGQIIQQPDYIHEKQLLIDKFEGDQSSKEFTEAFNQLNYKYCPELKELHSKFPKSDCSIK